MIMRDGFTFDEVRDRITVERSFPIPGARDCHDKKKYDYTSRYYLQLCDRKSVEQTTGIATQSEIQNKINDWPLEVIPQFTHSRALRL